jgi:hypothetical protein
MTLTWAYANVRPNAPTALFEGLSGMISAKSYFVRLSPLAIILAALIFSPAQQSTAQQFLGNSRERCSGPITLQTPGGPLEVRPFEARSAEIGDTTISWNCQGQQQATISCPPNTNKILVDRSQGGSALSIICLHK